MTWLAQTADQAVAWYVALIRCLSPKLRLDHRRRYLDAHVRAGYKFIMQNYREGDKICLFGVWTL